MLENIKVGYTHGGCFHSDDVFSTVFLKRMNKDIQIKRVLEVTDEMRNDESAIIFDIGWGKFDHHQPDVELDDKGVRYSAFGLLWREYGKAYLASLGFKHIDEAFEAFKEDVVYKIDLGDNHGYKNVERFAENNIVKSFYLKWYETSNEETLYNQFEKAVMFIDLIWDNKIRNVYQRVEAKAIEDQIWKKANEDIQDHAIYLEKRIPWEFHLTNEPNPDIHFVVFRSDRGGYIVRSADDQMYPVKPNKYMSFVHNSGFMGVADTLELAKLAIKQL